MKIVHIEEFFHPDAGYQVNLLSRLQQSQGQNVTVVTAELKKIPTFLSAFFNAENIDDKDKKFEQDTGVKIVRIPLLAYYSGRAIFYPRLFRIISDLNPDVVLVHGVETFTGMLFMRISKSLKYPVVFDTHMLEMASRNRFSKYFQAFFRRFFTGFFLKQNISLIRVVDSDYVQKCLGIPLDRTELLSFGTDTEHFRPNPNVKRDVRARLGLDSNVFLVVYAGKLDESKGGIFLAEVLREKISLTTGNTIAFLVIGNGDGPYGDDVENLFSKSENKLIRLPTQRYYDLAQYYQAADLAIFPKQCSLSFFEAQSCGLPVLFEENEINIQRILNGNAFKFSPGNVKDFREKLMQLASLASHQFDELRVSARNYVIDRYDYIPIAKRFTQILESAVIQWKRSR